MQTSSMPNQRQIAQQRGSATPAGLEAVPVMAPPDPAAHEPQLSHMPTQVKGTTAVP